MIFKETVTKHPRVRLFAFTGTLVDEAVECVAETVRTLGRGMKRIMTQVRAYPGSPWQTALSESPLHDEFVIHPHVHAAFMLPCKGQPTAEDMHGMFKEAVGANVAKSTHFEKAYDPEGWLAYVTGNGVELSNLNQHQFDTVYESIKGLQFRGKAKAYVN